VGRLHERLEAIESKQDRVLVGIASLEARCTSCQRDILGLQSTVYGNGTAGLKTRTERLEFGRRWMWAFLTFLAMGIPAAVAVLEYAGR
jgi:hypothetical protein